MDVLYIMSESDIKQEENTICVRQGKNIKRFPIKNLNHIVIGNDCTFTTKFINLCGKNNISISFTDYYGWYKGIFLPKSRDSGYLKLIQSEHYLNDKKRIKIASTFLEVSKYNILSNLKYYEYRGNNNLTKNIKEIENIEFSNDYSINQLMGYEGMMRTFYYESWSLIDNNLEIKKRIKRPPSDIINCLISFLNSLLYSRIQNIIRISNLDDTISYLHSTIKNRTSLSLDFSEIYKPLICDRLIYKIIRKKILKDNWFNQEVAGVCLLTEKGLKELTSLFETNIEQNNYKKIIWDDIISFEKYLIGINKDIVLYKVRR